MIDCAGLNNSVVNNLFYKVDLALGPTNWWVVVVVVVVVAVGVVVVDVVVVVVVVDVAAVVVSVVVVAKSYMRSNLFCLNFVYYHSFTTTGPTVALRAAPRTRRAPRRHAICMQQHCWPFCPIILFFRMSTLQMLFELIK